jgi:hypothetical protein
MTDHKALSFDTLTRLAIEAELMGRGDTMSNLPAEYAGSICIFAELVAAEARAKDGEAQAPAVPAEPTYSIDDLRAARSEAYSAGVSSAAPKKVTADMRRVFREAFREGGFWADRLDYALDAMLAAAPQPEAQAVPAVLIERVKFTDQSTAGPIEKARRYLQAMADHRINNVYQFYDGYPKQATADDAAATLAVFEQLVTHMLEAAPQPEAADKAARFNFELVQHFDNWLISQGHYVTTHSEEEHGDKAVALNWIASVEQMVRAALAAPQPEADSLANLLREVAGCFTRDDDLPNNLLTRIDAALAAQGGV